MKINIDENIKRFLMIDFDSVPEKYKNEFILQQTRTNLAHEKILCEFLVIASIFVIIADVFSYFHFKRQLYPGIYLFYFHIILAVVSVLFLLIMKNRNNRLHCKNFDYDKLLSNLFIVFMLFWSSMYTIFNQLVNQQIATYIIWIFFISATMIINPKKSLPLYIFTYFIFSVGIFVIQQNFLKIYIHVINGGVTTCLAFLISKIIFSSYANNFINKKIILEKSLELEEAQVDLEDKVEKRTEELSEANKRLIDEINARHEMEIQIVKTQEYEMLRTEFFANISHEFRTPVNVLYSALQMVDLKMQNITKEDNLEVVNKYIKTMKQNCNRLIRLVGNLIDITKIDAGYLKIELENINLVSVVEEITLSVAQYVENNDIELIFDTEFEEKIIACDSDMIERIVLNLLSNAIKFTPSQGRIMIRIYGAEKGIKISVKDTGIGIPVENQSFIFEKFIQVDKSLSRNKEGSGIGLSLVKSLVEMHKGNIYVISEYGQGSEFIIELPDYTVDKPVRNMNYADFDNEKIERINIEFSDIYS